MQYLPSKKFIIIFSFIFGALIIFFITTFFIGRKEQVAGAVTETEKKIYAIKAGQSEKISVLVSKDSDRDGLLDWEESLWGTDANKKDTNGNGVLDNLEVENKKKELRESGLLSNGATSEKNLNETEKFSREFFTTFIALRESGNLSPEAVANLSVSLANAIGENSESITFIKIDDLAISADPNFGPKEYALLVKAAAGKFSGQKIGYEMEILAKGISEENERAMNELSLIAESYRRLAGELKQVPVPTMLSRDHLVLINSALGMAGTLKELSAGLSNPLGAMPALGKYDTFSRSFIEIVDKIDSFLK